MTVRSKVGIRNEAHRLWYFGDEGIKRSKTSKRWEPDESSDLSAKEMLRWSKVCECLENYFRRNPARSKPQSEGQYLIYLLRGLEIDLESTIVVNVSNWPKDLLQSLEENPIFLSYLNPYEKNQGFLLILVALSLLYGGIHLATWNFAFASKTEHLLWKIACIDIMATVPIGFPSFYWYSFYLLGLRELLSDRNKLIAEALMLFPHDVAVFPNFGFLSILSVCYAFSRIYIVIESFISLRHVPIGVYAAVPWVQAIPHI